MLGASAGFVNPFSYQCNLMVYDAGNYNTTGAAALLSLRCDIIHRLLN